VVSICAREQSRRASCRAVHLASLHKLILRSILTFKDLKCLINKHNVLLFEKHKHSPKSNTVIITELMAVNRGKHSDCDNEPDYVI
jgi:hypothetical protein